MQLSVGHPVLLVLRDDSPCFETYRSMDIPVPPGLARIFTRGSSAYIQFAGTVDSNPAGQALFAGNEEIHIFSQGAGLGIVLFGAEDTTATFIKFSYILHSELEIWV